MSHSNPAPDPFTPAAVAELARADVARALAEDLGSGDLSAALIAPEPERRPDRP